MATIDKDSTINLPSINKSKAIKRVDGSDNEVYNIITIDIDSTGFVKVRLAKYENMI